MALNFAGTTPMSRPTILPDGKIMAGNREVGRVRLDRDGPALRIADIEIFPSERRQGLGSDVIRQIQEEARAAGSPVVLSTDAMRGQQAQIDQRRLYERLGFLPNRGADRVGQRIGGKFVAEEMVWRPEGGQ